MGFPWLIISIPQAHVLVSQGSGLKEHPARDGGPPAKEQDRTNDLDHK